MFADSFCDSAWANPSQRGWTTLASLVAQLLALGGLLVLPLLYMPDLPQFQWLRPELIASPPGANFGRGAAAGQECHHRAGRERGACAARTSTRI
jgi:hypothetical protein